LRARSPALCRCAANRKNRTAIRRIVLDLGVHPGSPLTRKIRLLPQERYYPRNIFCVTLVLKSPGSIAPGADLSILVQEILKISNGIWEQFDHSCSYVAAPLEETREVGLPSSATHLDAVNRLGAVSA